jgi:chromosome segregation ATPase
VKAAVKDAVAAVDVAVADCTALFEQSMEVVTSLQEDPNLQRLKQSPRELQQQYDEAERRTCTIAITDWQSCRRQRKLKEQVEAVQRKEAVLKARLGPWLDEAYVISATIEEKLASLQTTQQKIQEDSAGPTTEQLVEQVKQAATQCTTEVAVAQVELGGLRSKISMPSRVTRG